jgi:hypothetical protein
VAKMNLGVKRHCVRCSNRFYDLGKNPAACPKCKHMNDINAPFKPRRRGKAAPTKPVLVEKQKPVAKPVKAKTPVKKIEGVDVEEFEDIEIAGDEEIEEIDEGDEIETIEEIDEDATEETISDDISLEEADVVGAVLVDEVDDPLVVDDDDDAGEKAKLKTKDDKKVLSKPSAKGHAKHKALSPAKKIRPAPKKVMKPVKKPAAKKLMKKSKPAPKAKKKKR